jgi:hypothetical protein
MRFEGYYDLHELPLKKGDVVTIKKGTMIKTVGRPAKPAGKTYKVTVDHILNGRTEEALRQKDEPGSPFYKERIHHSNPTVVWPGPGGYWSEVDINSIPEATSALPTLSEIERKLGEKAEKWEGRCYEIACAIVRAGLVDGMAVYGHFTGTIHPDSYFGKKGRAGLPFSRHGWVLLKDGTILDATRWAFEAKDPYLYIGPRTKEYDEGGDQLRKVLHRPPPQYSREAKQVEFSKEVLPSASWTFIEGLLGIEYSGLTKQEPGVLSIEQVFWLANTPYEDLQPHAAAIYKAIAAVDLAATIPFDNRKRALRESP